MGDVGRDRSGPAYRGFEQPNGAGRRERAPTSLMDRIGALERRLDGCLGCDRARLARRLGGVARAARRGRDVGHALGQIERSIESSERISRARRAHRPKLRVPDELPVSARAEEIASAIRDNRVVVVCGETGSGKSTQLPKICLSIGRGIDGTIAHTQPRRIAARSVASRIAEETRLGLGGGIGYKVRFTDRSRESSLVRVMTDGILLAEARGDPLLSRYDTVIVDEAHERSLNIDFLLGILRRALDQRDDLRVVITSATINPERFSEHFWNAPIIEVSGRTYPVEMRYSPVGSAQGADQEREEVRAIVEAVDELDRDAPGDVLVFLPGEREIREAAAALRRGHRPGLEILPLYSRLSAEEQQRVFSSHRGRRVVLATNVAETSLTVPGIRSVVDTGLARISRFSHRTRVQRLEIEPVSRASAAQRAGRCGRLGPGVCVRLYSEEEFQSREEFTSPEIARSNLAGVILQMTSLGLGKVEDFPFVDTPDPRLVREGYRTLHELGAMDPDGELTEIGRQMAELPIDPRIARVVLAGAEFGCHEQMLILGAALSVPDARVRPHDRSDEADRAHAEFADPESDFLALLNLWWAYRDRAQHLSRRKLAAWCSTRFLSMVRLREWEEVRGQIATLADERGVGGRGTGRKGSGSATPDPESIHRAVLTGFVTNVGRRAEGHEYEGPHGMRFALFPGSGVFETKPAWVMAAELVRTTRLYARTVAAVKPEWIERAASHLVKRTYHEPRWERRRGRVNAQEKVSLYGLEVIPGRRVHYGPVNPVFCRETFIHRALIEGEYATSAPFAAHNTRLIEQVERLEARLRRRDLLASQMRRFEFFDARVPRDVYQGSSFERWRRWAERRDPRILFMSLDDVLTGRTEDELDRFPERVRIGDAEIGVDYRFEPGEQDDGATVTVPIEAIGQLTSKGGELDWAVPGLVRERVIELIRGLPKQYRRVIGPAREFAEGFLASDPPRAQRLTAALAQHIADSTGVTIPQEAWQQGNLPPHLRVRIRVVDADGRIVAVARDADELRVKLIGELGIASGFVPDSRYTVDGIRTWDFGDLPERDEFARGGVRLVVYPALVARGGEVSLRGFDDPRRAEVEHRRGVVQLMTITERDDLRRLVQGLNEIESITVPASTLGERLRIADELARLICDHVLASRGGPVPRTASGYAGLIERAWGLYGDACREVAETVRLVLELHQRITLELDRPVPRALEGSIRDARAHLGSLMSRGTVLRDASWSELREVPRYLRGIEVRLARLRSGGLDRDARAMEQLAPVLEALERLAAREGSDSPSVRRASGLIQELRVSLFAQELGTRERVSPERVRREIGRLMDG